MKHSFIYTDEKSGKFWTIETIGNSYIVQFGKIGTAGQIQTKEFEDEAACLKAVEKLIAEKTKKGYVEEGFTEIQAIKNQVENKKNTKSASAKSKEEENPWIHDKKMWGYYTQLEDDFIVKNLRDPDYVIEEDEDEKEEVQEDTKKEGLTANKLMTLYKEHSLENVIKRAAEAGNIEHVKFAYEAEKEYLKEHTDDILKRGLSQTLDSLLGFDEPYTPNTIVIIEWLLKEGAELSPTFKGDKYYSGIFFVVEYRKDPKPERVSEIFETYIDRIFKQNFENEAQDFRKYLEAVKNFEEVGGYYVFNPKVMFSPHFLGFEVVMQRVCGDYSARVKTLDINYEEVTRLDRRAMPKGLLEVEFDKYLKKYFIPELEKMAKEGLFNDLFPSGMVMFTRQGVDEPLFIHFIRPLVKEQLESILKYVEKEEVLAENIDFIPEMFYLLTKGIFGEIEEERAYRLVEKYLFGCDSYSKAQNLFFWMLDMTKGHPKMNYLTAKWRIVNKNFDYATLYIQALEQAGLEGAKELNKLLAIEKAKGELLKKPKGKQHIYESSFDISSAREEWKNKKNEDVFTENDLYLETKQVIVRARTNGNIYVRFIEENERSYGDALDFINRLLEKGYAYLSGGASEGFSINVRFLNKPVFVDEVLKVKTVSRVQFPKTTCHAFFAQAVKYQALRDKVVAYVERAMDKFTWYLDIQNEANTPPGTFAVAALMLCDKKYLPLVSLFAKNVDDGHMKTQLSFPLALADHYGNDPYLASALYDLAINTGFDVGSSKISATLLYNSDFIKNILTHAQITIEDIDDEEDDSFEYFEPAIGYLYGKKPKDTLKKIKEAILQTDNEQNKLVFAQFHDIYLGALTRYDESYKKIKPIKQQTPATEVISASLQDQEAVISLREAEKRGYDYDEDNWKRTILFFSPALTDDPETARYIKQQWRNIGLGNSKSSNEERCDVTVTYGEFGKRFGDWFISRNDMKYDCGLILSDRDKKPIILYGEVDALAIGIAVTKRWPKKLEEFEKLRQMYLIKNSKLRNHTESWIVEDELFEDIAAAYYSNWFSHTAKVALQKIGKEKQASYLASRIMLAHLAEIDADTESMKKLYSELISLQPEQKEYWSKKIESIVEK